MRAIDDYAKTWSMLDGAWVWRAIRDTREEGTRSALGAHRCLFDCYCRSCSHVCSVARHRFIGNKRSSPRRAVRSSAGARRRLWALAGPRRLLSFILAARNATRRGGEREKDWVTLAWSSGYKQSRAHYFARFHPRPPDHRLLSSSSFSSFFTIFLFFLRLLFLLCFSPVHVVVNRVPRVPRWLASLSVLSLSLWLSPALRPVSMFLAGFLFLPLALIYLHPRRRFHFLRRRHDSPRVRTL